MRDQCVKAGEWLYDGTVPCRVEVWSRASRPGTGDNEDDPDVRNDQRGQWYEIQYHVAGGGRPPAGGGYFTDLLGAVAAVEAASNHTVRWT